MSLRSRKFPADEQNGGMTTELLIRDCVRADAQSCAAIYRPYVQGTAISFEEDAPTAQEMAGRMAQAGRDYAWLVLEDAGRVVGYAYGHRFADRPAYRWSCGVSIYLEPGRRRTGAGRALYGRLLNRLENRGFRQALAGIALPNEASTGLHEAMGFRRVGVYQDVGFKFGAWHSVLWMQRRLGAAVEGVPAEPI